MLGSVHFLKRNMACINCQPVKNLYTCANSITIGTAPEAVTDYLVYFQNVATGKITIFPDTSDAQGVIVLTDIDADFTNFLTSSDYKVWVTIADPVNTQGYVPIIVDDVEYTCFLVRFERIYNSENVTVTGIDQEFELA